jgi:serine beta-lactamase-like protein LACTB
VAKRRIPIWFLVIAAIPVAILTFAGGLYVFMSVTAVQLHPNPQEIPSMTRSAPSPQWAGMVAKARDITRADLTKMNLPGLSVAVGVGGELVWAEGFGWADVENHVPVSPHMRFRMGTASMAVTSAAVGLLVEQGRLKLDDEIQTYVPEYPRKPWPVTLRQLMGHLAGVRTDNGDEGPYFDRCERPVEGLKLFKDRELLFEPGTRYRFSSFGWILVSAAVEAAAEEPFYRFMRSRIFEPAGMEDTLPDSKTEQVADRVTFYFPRYHADNTYGLESALDIDYSCYTGSAAFLSTPSDVVRFGMAVNGRKLLQPATVESFQTSQRLRTGEETGYGLGWDLETVELAGAPTRTVGHDGESIGGRNSSLLTFREQGIVVAVMTNTSWADTFGLAVKLANAFAKSKQ